MAVLDDMLKAAKASAGNSWNTVGPQLTTFAEQAVQDTAKISADLAARRITLDEAQDLFDDVTDFGAIIADYADTAIRAAIQAAFNAAVDVLWNAVSAAVPKAP